MLARTTGTEQDPHLLTAQQRGVLTVLPFRSFVLKSGTRSRRIKDHTHDLRHGSGGSHNQSGMHPLLRTDSSQDKANCLSEATADALLS